MNELTKTDNYFLYQLQFPNLHSHCHSYTVAKYEPTKKKKSVEWKKITKKKQKKKWVKLVYIFCTSSGFRISIPGAFQYYNETWTYEKKKLVEQKNRQKIKEQTTYNTQYNTVLITT